MFLITDQTGSAVAGPEASIAIKLENDANLNAFQTGEIARKWMLGTSQVWLLDTEQMPLL